ncbi:type II toxin-antitoxin system HicA family toxin [Methanoplanus limicola]|uniref:YcfA family protein n=1 Tax=Methanoplanus limicola DSM 2279 TaxID=937775 RepID=H1Z3I6_9EURY|nr:type II toxin-antitoxin system HicA family toxin [Methanoplanus limicola]EHQ34781.1 YcfA family protein [Methanoplanus limicola DSM 2279]
MRLPNLNPEKVIKVIKKKGFLLDRVKGSHHIYVHPETRQRVVIPAHKKDLPKGTLMEILKQAGINKDDFEDF